jgi:hypothetical protein
MFTGTDILMWGIAIVIIPTGATNTDPIGTFGNHSAINANRDIENTIVGLSKHAGIKIIKPPTVINATSASNKAVRSATKKEQRHEAKEDLKDKDKGFII